MSNIKQTAMMNTLSARMRAYRFKRSKRESDSGDEVIKQRTRTYKHCHVKVESAKGNKVYTIKALKFNINWT